MKSSVFTTSLIITLASAFPHIERDNNTSNEWIPGGADDFRGPCPMMNTLANHGFLPRDGRNITLDNAVSALTTGLNFDPAIAKIMWEQAIIANPEPNATFFTLDHLNRHNVLEHDASLSREDAAFGNNHIFNQTIFDTVTPYWTAETLDADMLANGKVARQLFSKAHNPDYTFTASVENFSLGELAAPILIFGDIAAGTTPRDQVIFFFENEKLPIELGWTKQASPIILDQIAATSKLIADAASLIIPSANTTTSRKRRGMQGIDSIKIRDSHFGGFSF